MTTFTYTALSADGRTTTGTVPADTCAAAIAAVVGQGLHPVRIEEEEGQRKPAATAPTVARTGRVTRAHIESFTRELASLLAGGVPLSRGLQLLRRETKAPGPQYLWGRIHEDVVGGTALADALAKHPRSFPSVYVAMVRAGEAGGFLDVVLNQIAEFRTREQDLKGKVKAAFVYPCVLSILAVGVLTFLLTYFIPTFKDLFAENGGALPLLTQMIMAASGALLSRYTLAFVAIVIVAGFLLVRYAHTDSGRRRIESVILGTPLVGNVVAFFAMVRFCRMLGTLLGAGVPLVAALRVAKEAIGNQTLADTVAFAIEQVQRGASLARSLGAAERLFPASVVEMIAIAEETGRLDKELVRLATAYELELDRRLRMLVALAEPALLFVMAGLIGTIVVGMLLPIFKIQERMH